MLPAVFLEGALRFVTKTVAVEPAQISVPVRITPIVMFLPPANCRFRLASALLEVPAVVKAQDSPQWGR